MISKTVDTTQFDKRIKTILKNFDTVNKSVEDFVLDDIKKNIENKSFDGKHWLDTYMKSSGSGSLANNMKAYTIGNTTHITNNLSYAKIQNEGGKIRVTDKMKSYFWYMYKKTQNEKWKRMAIMKKQFIVIPARPFLNNSFEFNNKVKEDINKHIKKRK